MRNKLYTWLIGIGILLFAIHNPHQPLIKYLFLPQVGMIITILATIYCLSDNRKRITFGSKFVYIPLLVIVGSIIASSIWQYYANDVTLIETLVPCVFGVILFGLYLVSRILGEQLFKPFTYMIIIETVSLIIYGLINRGVQTGGIVSPTNYDIAAWLLLFGLVVSSLKHQWWLSAVAIIGLFFTSAEEGLFGLAVLGLVIIIRRDFSKKIILPIGISIIIISTMFGMGIMQSLYQKTIDKVELAQEALTTNDLTERDNLLNQATGYRWIDHWKISPIKPFGYGYNINRFYEGIPHNIILIIIEQIGIIGVLAWLFATGYCLVKTKWKYAFILILTVGMFDHYIWTQVAPWYWVLVGVASTNSRQSDLIFKGVKQNVQSNSQVVLENVLQKSTY